MTKSGPLKDGNTDLTSKTSAIDFKKKTFNFRLLPKERKRLLIIALVAVAIAACVSVVAKLLVYLIHLITNIAFFGRISLLNLNPANNSLGLWVIIIPVIGGLIVGLMVLYGSKAIRGHGIPEAMEQILTNQSRIRPAITYLKPISSAIAIGTGGPFGAEGPIIATGGALGSTIGQTLKISHNERKILLAAGATAGMSAIFGTPIAAIFLAIELLLFEFSPRSIIPVALACITGAAGHHLLFGQGPVFPMETIIEVPGNMELLAYSALGIVLGILSVFVSKAVYLIEDGFERLPIHHMWWPAIGGLAVGIVGYFVPRSLGVGYYNIIDILSGNIPMQLVLSLCIAKFISWSIALGSGTSGGTLAPLLIIGGAIGALLGGVIYYLFPQLDINISLAALLGMSAMFAGASRALLTSIAFALESTGQFNALLPLLAACTAAYMISFIFMKNTIMTEKIARKGVRTPDSFEPDILEKVIVEQVLKKKRLALNEENTLGEVREWLNRKIRYKRNFYIVTDSEGDFKGIIDFYNIMDRAHDDELLIGSLKKCKAGSIQWDDSLRKAVEMMAMEDVEALSVISRGNNVVGVISYHDILTAYKLRSEDFERKKPNISLKRSALKMLLHGQKLITVVKKKG
jgi:CIC family chloride channel protein